MIKRILFSLLASFGIFFTLNPKLDSPALSNNIAMLLIFLLYWWAYSKTILKSKKETWFIAIMSIIMAFITVIGRQLDIIGEIDWSFMTIIVIVCCGFSFLPLIYGAVRLNERINAKNVNRQKKHNNSNKTINQFQNLLKHYYKKHPKLLIYFIISFFGFLVWLSLFPGVYGYDAGAQITEFLDQTKTISSHFSVSFSFILSTMVKLGGNLFGNFNAGLAIFTLIQMLFMSYVATRVCFFTYNLTKNRVLFWGAVAFFSIFPLYTIMTVSVAQDIVFSGIFVLLFLELYDLSKDASKYWSHKSKFIILPLIIFTLCIARNNGPYLLLVAIPILILFLKKKKMLSLLIMVAPIILYGLYNIILLNALSVEKGDTIKEMSSVPSQQIARVYVNYGNSFTNEQLEEINQFYQLENFDKYYEYNPSIADQMKAGIKSETVKKNPLGYLAVWCKNGLKHLDDYAEAFLMNNYAYWYPNKSYPDTRMYHPLIEFENLEMNESTAFLDIKRNSQFPLYENLLALTIGKTSQNKPSKGGWQFIPVISTFFTIGCYTVIFLFSIAFSIYYKRWSNFVPFSILFGLYVTLLLSPVALLRYCFAVIMLAPAMAAMIIKSYRNRN